MRYALISDIHANLEALQAVLKDIESRKVDRIHCLGDIVGYGCDPVECVDLIIQHCDIRLMGNHEYVVLGLHDMEHLNDIARISMEWTQEQLTDRELSILADLQMDAEIENAYLVHASPYEPDRWHYVLAIPEAKKALENLHHPIGFIAHSHLPRIFSGYPDGECGSKVGHDFHPDPEYRYLVNVGSVGQPRDNDARSCYVIYDTNKQEICYHRVEYNVKLTQAKMSDANVHRMLVERLEVGR